MFLKYQGLSKLLFRTLDNNFSRNVASVSNLLQVNENDGVRRITLTSSKTRNALSMEMMNVLLDNIKDSSSPSLRCIVLTSTGPVFSSGHNLKELSGKSKEYYMETFTKCAELMQAVIEAPVPVMAGVNGTTAAAGCQLVATCDIVIATDNSHFSTPGANFGIFCSTPGIAVSRSVGRKGAARMLLTGEPVSAHEALMIGLISVVCKEDELDVVIDQHVRAIKSKSRAVIELGKQFFYKQVEMDIKSAYRLGSQVMSDNLLLTDGQEGVSSFIQKRSAQWRHDFQPAQHVNTKSS